MKTKTDQKKMEEHIDSILTDRHVEEMKKYLQHGGVSTYEHCRSVAKLCYVWNEKLHLKANLWTLLVGAMLHDFYLYDWHDRDNCAHRRHAFHHAELAAENARKYLGVDRMVQHTIRCHMWPLNMTKLPRSREAWIVCVADKCVACYETFFRRGQGTCG